MTSLVLQQLLAAAPDLVPLLQANPAGAYCFVALVICATIWHPKR